MRPARSDEPGRQSCSGQTSKTSQEAARGSVGKGLASAHLALVLFVALSLLPAASFGQDAQTAGTAQQGSAVEETGDNPAEPADAPAADTDIALADATTASADTINLSDPNPGSGTNWSYDSASGTFTISAGAVTVTGNTSTRRVVVAGFAAITLSGATINLIGTDSAVPIDIVGSANVRLTLRGDSTLRGGTEAAAMRVADTASLTVTAASTGSLTAIGGEGIDGDPGGAGIQGGSITIQGGTLDARGNESDAAGISASSITISDGRVEAQGGWNTAGITAETIQISGGKVRATGGYCAAGIGGNIGESVGNITISGGTVEANGGDKAAGIGGGQYGGDGTITVSGGDIRATGGGEAAGIGIGADAPGGSAEITISGGTLSAMGGSDAPYAILAQGSGSTSGSVTISGGSVKASSVFPAPTSAASGGTPVYLNTLTVGSPAIADGKAVSNLAIDGAASSYGLAGVVTKYGGKLYFWLGENIAPSAQARLEAEGFSYGAAYARRPDNNNAATLLPSVVTISAIPIPAPVAGATPATTAETAQYSGTVSWSPALAGDGSFAPYTTYTATITLTPKTGYTFEGIGADFFTVAGATLVQNAANSGTVTAAFPATGPAKAALESTIKEAKAIAHTFQTKASWDALQAAIAKGEAVDADPDATEAEVAAALTAINDALAALYFDYPVMEAFGTWSGTGPLSARINADLEYFVQLKLNGSLVATTNYTVTSGSTVLTLHEDYLKSLPAGNHSFIAEFSNGTSAPMSLTISGDTAPQTGESILGAAALVAALTAAAAASLLLSRYLRRRPQKEGRC